MFCQAGEGRGRRPCERDRSPRLKPANIFLARNETEDLVKVLDFGVASLFAGLPTGHLNVTRAGSIVGTPQYMSPEQVRGSAVVDYRSDSWPSASCVIER